MTIYLGQWTDRKSMIKDYDDFPNYDGFEVNHKIAHEIMNADIIIACYNREDYEGQAFVLLRKDEKLYEVNDSHCSCNGLQNWEPEETTKEALLKRSQYFGIWQTYKKELKEIIEKL